MGSKRQITVFTVLSGEYFSATIYEAVPIASDYRWGAYRRAEVEGAVYHVFQRGGLLSDGAVKDIIDAHASGRTRKISAM